MTHDAYEVENLIKLLGAKRSDPKLLAFIIEYGANALFTVDKEDDADNEFAEFKEQGFGFYFENDVLLSISLHSAKNDPSYAKYKKALPSGLNFGDSKANVIAKLGNPDELGGGRWLLWKYPALDQVSNK